MNNHIWFDSIGWLGAAVLLIGYALVSFRRVAGDSLTYQALNIAGSLFLAANTIAFRAYPSAFVNLVWIGIAIFSLANRKGPHSV
jgi:drug/metabolite transporter (DMT)-like permease